MAFDKAGNYSIGIVGNKTEADYRALTGNLKTSDVEDYNSKKLDDSVNVLYVDGADSVMNGTHSEIRDANYKVAAFVRNNAPRLAGVRVWTDYNGNSTEDTGESSTYYYAQKEVSISGVSQVRASDVTSRLVVSGNGNDKENGGTAFAVIKDVTKFYPVIVGGNGKLHYKRTINGNENTVFTLEEYADGNNIEDYKPNGYVDVVESTAIEVGATVLDGLDNSSNEAPTWFDYEIHDSTEGTTKFVDSLSASMSIALNVQYKDENLPKVDVERFFWNGPTDNSLYKNSRSNGHIELAPLSKKTETTDYDDTDPKVSGKITLRGVAYDDIRLKNLSFKGLEIAAYTVFATYSNGVWTVPEENKDTKELSGGLKWTASVKDIFADARGHQVAWEINIDTNTFVGLNNVVTVRATDVRGENVSFVPVPDSDSVSVSGTVSDYDKEEEVLSFTRPTYTMDVVPYITDVTTRLSGKVKQNKSIYSRFAKGKYSIDGSETVTFEGFNLGTSNSNITISETGDYQYKNGEIPAINNYNNNDASGNVDPSKAELKDKYNMQGNGITDDTLTDDISFLVWDINKQAATPIAAK